MKLIKLINNVKHPYGIYSKNSVFREIKDFQYFDNERNFIITTGQKTSNKINSTDFQIVKSLGVIEWSEESGNLGGREGVKILIKEKEIIYFNKKVKKIGEEDKYTIKYTIEKNLKHISERLEEIQKRLDQKETKQIKIDNGYIISEPLSDKKRELLMNEKHGLLNKKIFLENLTIEDLL